MKIQDVRCDCIHDDLRFRKDVGDVEELAENIREIGLLQPIGLDEHYRLIFGARRLWACSVILEWETVPCVILKMDSLLLGEYAENTFRKQFTKSEQVAIANAVAEELGNRKGANLKVHADAGTLPKGETDDLAAKAGGFGSAETYKRARKVIELGIPELKAAMDDGKITVNTAAKIADQPAQEQKKILEMPKEDQAAILRRAKKTKADHEKGEKWLRDVHLFRTLYDSVAYIATFQEDPQASWDGLNHVACYDFAAKLPLAIACLVRIDKEHPNAPKRPVAAR